METWEDGTPKSSGVWFWKKRIEVKEETPVPEELPEPVKPARIEEKPIVPLLVKTHDAIFCPHCGTQAHRVLETRTYSNGVKVRRKQCKDGHRWTTVEAQGKEFMNRRSKRRSKEQVGGYERT